MIKFGGERFFFSFAEFKQKTYTNILYHPNFPSFQVI